MSASFTMGALKRFLASDRKKPPPPTATAPIVVNVDLAPLAAMFERGIKVKGGITQMPS